MAQSLKVELLHGLIENGRRHTLAELREATGRDEAMLADASRDATPAERISMLLAALVLRIGEIETPAMDRILELSAGDRERLVLALCARLMGAEVDLTATCPSCSTVAEMPIRFAEVLALHDAPIPDGLSHVELDVDGGIWTARLRPAKGADLERAARAGSRAARGLIVGCIEELRDSSGKPVIASALPSVCEAQLADALLALDPAAETRVVAECPSCGQPLDALLDGYTLLRGGLGGVHGVYDEVFRMARAYHWSEAEILSLPLRRRRHYLAIAEVAGAPR